VDAVSVEGVDEIITVKVDIQHFEPDVQEHCLRAVVDARRPALILVSHSVDALGYAPALAARGSYGFCSDVFHLDFVDDRLVATRGGYRQKVNMTVDFPNSSTVVLMLRGGSFKAPESKAAPTVTNMIAPVTKSRVRHVGFIDPQVSEDVDLASADFILAVGRGIGEESNVEKFRDLASKLGATLGCSRPVADAGWLPKSRQVGQSGKTAAACKLYVAMGISGAIQHLAGMKHVPTIMAVNKDASASIFSVAHYGVIADVIEFADALERHLKSAEIQ
jgi:electron transfer flavoprotein alpha subunit